MEKQRRRDVRGIVGKVAAVVFAAGFVLSIVPAIRALAEGTIFKIQSAEITEISAGATGNISTYDEQNIVSNITFHKINDSVSYKIVLKNSDAKDYVIESITDDNTSEQISYAYDDHAGETIAAGADLDFLLTAKFATPVTDMAKRAMASSVKFFIKFAEKEEPEEIDIIVPDIDDETPEEPEEIDIVVPNTDAETPVVPDTGANTKDSKGAGISLATMIISVVGLTVLAFIAVKKHKKYAKIIGVAVVAVSAFGLVTSARAANIETNSFTLTTNYGFYDKLVIKNGDKDVVIDYGEKLEDVDEITEPTKPGYTFDGWEDENGNPVDPTKPITEDITIKPKFVANTYTVKFDANGGDGTMADMQFTYDEAQVLTQNAFNFMGREYTGWDTKPNGSGVHYADKAEVKNLTTENNGIVTLYAQWSINPFHIDYDGNGATSGEMATTNCEYDEACELRDNAFEKYGYDFAGWKYNDTIYADKADVTNIIDHGTITMQAQWTPHIYAITYTGLTTEEAAALRTAGNPDNYTIETTSFTLIKPADRKDADGDVREHCVGWRDATVYEDVTLPISNALGDKTYEAVWQTVALEEFDITYDYDGGNVATANPTKLNKEQSATLNEPTKTGYTFTGWTGTTIEGSTPVKPYTIPAPHQKGNLAYTAHYRANNYTIAFDGNGATSGSTASTSMTYDEAKNLTANGFARTGYTFAGWKLGDTEYTDGQTVKNLTTEDGATVKLKAQWAPIHYNVAFHQNADNVSGNMPSMTVAYDESTPLTENTFALEHYKFIGWNTAEDGTGAPYEDKASIKNLTATDGATIDLYAQWKERTATLNTGANVRTALKGLADAPTTFKKYDGENLPDFDTLDGKVDIALADSNFPVWAWVDGDNIYWWSEAERPNFNRNSSTMFQSMTTLTTIDLDGLESSTAVNMANLFNGCTSLTDLDISEFNTANVENMSAMFHDTPALTSINTAVLNTVNVKDMSSMFRKTGATSIDISNFDTGNVKTMARMFEYAGASSITLGNPNTLNVTNMSLMFSETAVTSLDVSGLDTDNVESMSGMFEAFYVPSKMTSLNVSNFKTSKVKDFSCMFYGQAKLTSLDVSNFDTSSATSMYMMFISMTKAESINVSGWTNDLGPRMDYMFSYTGMGVAGGTVINFENFNTENVTNMDHMFSDMRSETVLDLSGFDTAKVTKMGGMFSASYASTPMALKTVYVSDKFVTTALTGTQNNIFDNTRAIVGGAGTEWDASSMEKARIDDPDNGEPGYFTIKDARYIRYNGNGADNATPYGAMTSEYLKAGDSLKKNAFIRRGFRFTGWKDTDGNEYTDEQVMTELVESKTPLELYAQWIESTSMLHAGLRGIADDINSLAGDDILDSFEKYNNGTPDIDNLDTVIVSTSDSYFPTYIWREGNKVYWWSEADKVYMNPTSGNMFYAVRVKNVSLAGLDSSKVTNLSRMFQGGIVESVDFGSDFDTSHVTTMGQMFWRTTGITSLDLSSFSSESLLTVGEMFTGNTNLQSVTLGNSFTLSDVTSMASMFNGCSSLESIDLSKVTFENVTTISNLFDGASALTNITLGQNINAEKLTDAASAFKGTSSLAELDLSSFHAPNLADMSDMFRTTGVKNLDLSNLGATNITNIHEAFWGMANLETIDISNLKLSGSQSPAGLFFNDSKLTTIYANYNTDFSSATSSTYGTATRLRGGADTSPATNPSYLRIDDPDNDKPGVFTLRGSRYIRYNGNGADNATPYGAMTSEYLKAGDSLKKNAFTRSGYEFAGWKDADGNDYTDEQVMTDLAESKTPLELYAQWEEIRGVLYHANGQGVEGSMSIQDASAGDSVELKSTNFSRAGYGFAGWNTKADGTGVVYGPNQTIVMPEGAVFDLYAMWIAPEQDVTMQTFDASAEPYASAAIGTVKALRDIRDDNVYTVAKLADGKWWMTENLRLDLSTHGDKINSSNTHNPLDSFITEASVKPESAPFGSAACSPQPDCLNTIRFVDKHITRADDNMVYGKGVFYNWHVATAGHGANMTIEETSTEGDICSRGWHLPTGKNTTTGEYYALARAIYNSDTPPTDDDSKFTEAPNNFLHSGWGSDASNLQYGYYWTSTFRRLTPTVGNAYNFTFAKGYASYNSAPGRGALLSVRCVAD